MDVGFSLEELPEAMNDGEEWRKPGKLVLAARNDDDDDDDDKLTTRLICYKGQTNQPTNQPINQLDIISDWYDIDETLDAYSCHVIANDYEVLITHSPECWKWSFSTRYTIFLGGGPL